MTKPKVFCIGFQKTGTTSLGAALEMLGYDVCGYLTTAGDNYDRDIRRLAMAAAEAFDAFQDNPWPLLFRQLDLRYPGSKFILTVRPDDAWIASVRKHFGRDPSDMQRWVYGHAYPVGHERDYVQRYRQHNEQVRAYFAQRPDDLLEMRLTAGEGWDRLCSFLHQPVPQTPFPHRNRAQDIPRRRFNWTRPLQQWIGQQRAA